MNDELECMTRNELLTEAWRLFNLLTDKQVKQLVDEMRKDT